MVSHAIPKTYAEALEILKDGTHRVVAGGTDMMVRNRAWAGLPPAFDKPLLFAFNLPELKYVRVDEKAIYIGSMTDLETLLHHEDTPSLLREVIGEMASPAIRYVSTLAGNIVNASPAADSLLALYALDAQIVLESVEGKRVLPIEKMILGPGKTVLDHDEIIAEIRMPKSSFTHTAFRKVGGRRADAITKVGFIGCAVVDDGIIRDLRLIFNAVAPTLVRVKSVEALHIGHAIEDVLDDIETITHHYAEHINPIDDQRSNRAYRKETALELARHFIKTLQ